MSRCPTCEEETQFNHAPDDRCDVCAEEYGCECGCFPSPSMRRAQELIPETVIELTDVGWELCWAE